MKVVTLMENTACREGLSAAHGLSLYIETPRHKILFDMGPDDGFVANAGALGVDLGAVDLAILSHGHYDHGGGLGAFCAVNGHAPIYIHQEAFGPFYALDEGAEPRYIGLDPALERLGDRLVRTGSDTRIDEELTLFANVPERIPALAASAKLQKKTESGFVPDTFPHEQNLLVQAEGKTVLFAGCAHMGAANIWMEALQRTGRAPDTVFAGFHLMSLTPGQAEAEALLAATGAALQAGDTVYYTGHCTGDYAYETLKAMLGDRLRRFSGGLTVEL